MKQKLKPYGEYKKIDLSWLNEVPSHWKITRNKNVMRLRKNVVGDQHDSYTLLSLTLNGIIARDMVNAKGKFPKDFSTYQSVENNNLVFCLFDIDETPRTVGLSPLDGMITGAYTVFEVHNALEKYLYYYYLSLDNKKLLKPLYTGLRKVISTDTFLRTKLPLPSHEEQIRIVKYLDFQLAKINKFIKAKKRIVFSLKEQKQAIINKAVTKGINPDAEMKPSGFRWLGDIPIQWDLVKLKFLSNEPFQYGANESGIPFSADQPRYIRITDVTSDGNLKEDNKLSLPVNSAKNYMLSDGDILFARSGATVGKTFLFKEEYGSSCYAGYLIKFTPNKQKVTPEYVYNFSLSTSYYLWLNQIFIQSTIQNVSAEKYKNLLIPLPSLEEQSKIIDYINSETKSFNTVIEQISREIELITEYRTRLIFDVVTGKVDVRDIIVDEIFEEVDMEEINEEGLDNEEVLEIEECEV